jgi:hypothetical protein
MANRYVRHTSSNTSPYDTWAKAATTIVSAVTGESAGDVIYVSQVHSESSATQQNIALAGTAASPVKVICGNDSAEPPTATATTAVVTTTNGNAITVTGFGYLYGITFNIGSGVNNVTSTQFGDGGTYQEYEDCAFNIVATGGNAPIALGTIANTQPTRVIWRNCTAKIAASAQGIVGSLCTFEWYGGSVSSGSSAATSGFFRTNASGEHNELRVLGVNLEHVGVTGYLCGKISLSVLRVKFINCKIPAFTTGGLYTGTLEPSDRIELYNCDSADTNYRLWIADLWGEITSDISVYNDAGADDGSAQGFSWKMVSTANAEFPHQTLVSGEIVKWNDTTTGTLTATVEIVHNSQGSGTNGALRDDEIWLEVMCMDPGATPVGKWQSDRCANLNLNSNAADQDSSAAAWTGDAAGWDTQKLSVSFTPKEKGFVHARVCLAKASATVYIDPLLTIA